jgi:hypothetical protein
MDALTQRREALLRANQVRERRAALRRELAADKLQSREQAKLLLGELPSYLESCLVVSFVKLLPGIGHVRASAILRRMSLKPTTVLGTLSDKRRAELAIHIASTGAS